MTEFLHRTHFIMIFAMLGLAFISFFFLFYITAPYGRYVGIKNGHKHMSKRLGWLIMEVPAVITILLLWIFSDVGPIALFSDTIDFRPFLGFFVFLFIWEFHYVYRTFIATFLTSDVKKSFRYYVIIMGATFNIINGLINGWFLFFYMPTKVLSSKNAVFTIFTSIHFIVGIIIFISGFLIHVKSDKVLREIKKKNQGEYGIPYTFLHRYIASPNYLGEIVQWIGWAILTWSLAGLTFALFTFANLVPRAYSNLKWYRDKFEEYPSSRKALIPFIY